MLFYIRGCNMRDMFMLTEEVPTHDWNQADFRANI
jgi:hypothetical protein